MDMNTIRRAQLGFAAILLAGGFASAAAAQDRPQQPATPPSDQAAPPPSDAAAPPADQAQASDKMASKKVEGELLSVDDATKTLSIRTKDGSEVKVAYNEQTQITGATDQAAGLATAAGSKVKVETTGEGASAIATKITVEAKDKK
jgi:YD repeat-containing protein